MSLPRWVPPASKLHLLISPANADVQWSISTMQAQHSAYLAVPVQMWTLRGTPFPRLGSDSKPASVVGASFCRGS